MTMRGKPTDQSAAAQYDQPLVDIVEYVYEYHIESAEAWQRAEVALLDALGCMIESLTASPDVGKLIGPIVPETKVPNGSRILGTGLIVDPMKAAFDIATLIRYLDHNDGYTGNEWGHPSDNLGAILAILDWVSRSGTHQANAPPPTIHTLLEALIKAYEIQGCLQQLNAFNAVGLDRVILVKVASTAVVSWLLGLSKAQALAALSHAWQDGHPLRTYRQAPNVSPRKGWAAGDVCMRAVFLALLARTGQPGAPTVLTARQWGFNDVLFRGRSLQLDRPYGSLVVETVFFKLVPAEGHGISAVQAAVVLAHRARTLDLKLTRLTAIHIRTQKPGFTIINKVGMLRNPADRDHCLQYMVAVALVKGNFIEAQDYSNTSPWVSDAQIERLRNIITVAEDEEFTRDYLDPNVRSVQNAVRLVFDDGNELEESIELPIGHPKNTETIAHVRSKYRRNLGMLMPNRQVEGIERAVKDHKMALDCFLDMLVKPATSRL